MPLLFSPLRLGPLRVPNRLVRSATSDGLASPEGFVTEAQLSLYRALAAGGAGLIVTGNAFVDALGRSEPAMLAVDRDACVVGLARLAQVVHAAGNRVLLQLHHAGRQTRRALIDGRQPVGPSELPWKGERGPRALSREEIAWTSGRFVAGARRARDAGFDGVQIHAAHGYLPHQFLSPHTNLRTDDYGGDIAGRARFLLEVVKGIRRECGPAFALSVKMNGNDLVAGGLTPPDAAGLAACVVAAGAHWVEVSGGILFEQPRAAVRPHLRIPAEEAYFREDAATIRRAISPVPVSLVGGLRSLAVMEAVLTDGTCDLVALSRPFIYEPDFGHRLAGAALRSPCISCNLCALRVHEAGLRCHVREALQRRGRTIRRWG